MLSRMEAIARATTKKWDGEVLAFNGEPDHVHLLLELTPQVAAPGVREQPQDGNLPADPQGVR